jgi:4-amino-4-deoxy-L-arabinose transferase-like glycosyltransferase
LLTRPSADFEKSSRVLLLLIILLATGLRIPGFFANHFHADEALFASWARLIAIWRDPLLVQQAVDKPPLLFYLQALAFPLFGPVEWAARLPNMIASILLIPLTAVFAWRLFHNNLAPLIAALLVATSPMAIQFSPTAFTDPLLTAFLIGSLLFAVGRTRPLWSGLFFGLAVFTKYQAWLFFPLLVGLGWLSAWEWGQWRKMAAGLLPPVLLFLVWQLIRSGSLDLWSTQVSNFGGVRLAWSWELLPRLVDWVNLWPITLGPLLMTGFFVAGCLLIWFPISLKSGTPPLADRMLTIFIFVYLSLHWLLAVPIWDRYLLTLVPISSVIIGRGISLLGERFSFPRNSSGWLSLTILFLIALIQISSAFAAQKGLFAIGGQSNADQGAWQVAQYLENAPYGTVLYDHDFSWHWRYAFIDKGVYVSWFEHPTALAKDLHVFGSTPGDRYLVLPDNASTAPVLRSVEEAGFKPQAVLHTDTHPGMILYHLESS